MNRKDRDKFVSGTDQSDLTTGAACWETPPLIWQWLNEKFGPFDIDLTADAKNHLLDVWLGPGGKHEDALAAAWHQCGGNGYSNPPYGRFVGYMLEKAAREAAHGFRTTLLLPLRMTKVMRQAIFHSGACTEWHILDKRITFFENGAPRLHYDRKRQKLVPAGALFDSTILVFERTQRVRPDIFETHVPPHVPKTTLTGR